MKRGLPYEVAAQRVQILVNGTGEIFDTWRCRTCGAIYPTENSAAYCHATDRKCQDCDNRTERHYTHCKTCRGRRDAEHWQAMPEVEWDGVTALSLNDSYRYFFNTEELADYCVYEGIEVDDLMLVVCKHIRPYSFSLDDFLASHGLLPDDQYAEDFGIDVAAIEQAVNDAVAKVAESVWEPCGKRPSLDSLKRQLS